MAIALALRGRKRSTERDHEVGELVERRSPNVNASYMTYVAFPVLNAVPQLGSRDPPARESRRSRERAATAFNAALSSPGPLFIRTRCQRETRSAVLPTNLAAGEFTPHCKTRATRDQRARARAIGFLPFLSPSPPSTCTGFFLFPFFFLRIMYVTLLVFIAGCGTTVSASR